MRPVSGAAIHNTGMSSTPAPSVWKMRLMFEFCRANANWMPTKPKHMFQICQNPARGRVVMDVRFSAYASAAVAAKARDRWTGGFATRTARARVRLPTDRE